MEFIINPSLLREELGLLTPVIERKATIPVLSKIKMETNASGELALTATDLDVTMRSLQVTDVLQTGSILVEGKKLYDKRETEMKRAVEKETRQELKEKLR